MSRKKRRSAPVQFTLFSTVCLVLCWIAVTALAFFAGYGLGSTERTRTAASRSALFERSGGASSSVELTFPHILGSGDTDPKAPKVLPEPSPSTGGTARLAPSPEEPQREREESALAGRVTPGGPRTEALGESASGDRLLQVASFREPSKAEVLVRTLERRGYRSFSRTADHPHSGEPIYRVFVGPFPDLEQAEKAKADLETGGGFHGVFIRSGAP